MSALTADSSGTLVQVPHCPIQNARSGRLTGCLRLASIYPHWLTLFLLTFIINGMARLLILVTTQRGSGVGQ